jgi:hypothetical protein
MFPNEIMKFQVFSLLQNGSERSLSWFIFTEMVLEGNSEYFYFLRNGLERNYEHFLFCGTDGILTE